MVYNLSEPLNIWSGPTRPPFQLSRAWSCRRTRKKRLHFGWDLKQQQPHLKATPNENLYISIDINVLPKSDIFRFFLIDTYKEMIQTLNFWNEAEILPEFLIYLMKNVGSCSYLRMVAAEVAALHVLPYSAQQLAEACVGIGGILLSDKIKNLYVSISRNLLCKLLLQQLLDICFKF